MKKLLLILLLVPFLAIAQDYDDLSHFYTLSRSVNMAGKDLGKISNPQTITFTIKNPQAVPIQIVGFKADQGIGVTIKNSTIPANSKGEILVTVHPDMFNEKGDFKKIVVVIFKYTKSDGTIVTEQKPFIITGSY